MLFEKGIQLIGLLQGVCKDDFGKAGEFSNDASGLGVSRVRIPVRLEESATESGCLWAGRRLHGCELRWLCQGGVSMGRWRFPAELRWLTVV